MSAALLDPVDEAATLKALATLSQAQRLRAFRILAAAGPGERAGNGGRL